MKDEDKYAKRETLFMFALKTAFLMFWIYVASLVLSIVLIAVMAVMDFWEKATGGRK